MLKSFIYPILFCSIAVITQAQTKLVAVPSKTILHQDETLQLQFVAEGVSKADLFTAPSFKNFEQIGDVIESNGWTWVNGSLTEYISYTYILRPKLKGRLAIASAIIKVNGKLLTSAPLTIQVTDAVTVNADVTKSSLEEKADYFLSANENAKEKIRKNLFVKVAFDKQSCYVGEAVLATFKLYTRLDSESKILKRPSFNGFSVIDLEEPETGIFTKEIHNGKLYNCYLIRKVQLFPLQSGELVIEPVEISNKVRFIRTAAKDGTDWMNVISGKQQQELHTDESFVTEEILLQTNPVHLNVFDLPANKPETFSGAVGHFMLKADVQQKQFTADETAVLRIEISGNGNLPMITTPAVNWPGGAEAFEARVTEELNKIVSPVAGIKVFDIPFTAVKGVYKIAPVVFSYFDVGSKKYTTLRTDSISFAVKEATIKKRNYSIINQVQSSVKKQPFNRNAVAGIIAFVIVGLLWWFLRSAKKQAAAPPPLAEKAQVFRPVENFITTPMLAKESPHYKQFFSLLPDGLIDFFIERFQLQHTKISTVAISEILRKKGMLQEAEMWNSLINRCEEEIFSPVALNSSKDELLADALALMKAVDEKITLL